MQWLAAVRSALSLFAAVTWYLLAETLLTFITKDMANTTMPSFYLGMVCGSRKISKGYVTQTDTVSTVFTRR